MYDTLSLKLDTAARPEVSESAAEHETRIRHIQQTAAPGFGGLKAHPTTATA